MNECKHESSRGPSPAMMEDGDYRRVCNDCLKRFEPRTEGHAYVMEHEGNVLDEDMEVTND